MILSMARKNYTDEFRRQAVDLYESTPGATLRASPTISGSPGAPCRTGSRTFGTGSTTAPISSPKSTAG